MRVGVIGVGNMGLHHARIYSQLEQVRLVAVADADLARARAAAARFGAVPYGDYHRMLDEQDLDAVSIVVPTHEHLPVALDVIARQVHLLVEKPLAADVQQAQALVSAAARAGVQLAVGHIERFNPAVQELKRQLDRGALGQISSAVTRRVGVMPPQVKDANVIIDLAVHDIDILNYLFGELPRVVSATGGHALLANRYDHAEIFLRYQQAGCFVQVNWITPLKIRTLSLTGEAGHAELNYITQKLEIFESTLAREYDNFGDFVVRFGEARRTQVPIAVDEPLKLELENFVNRINGGDTLIVTGAQGVQALQVATQALVSIALTPELVSSRESTEN